MRGAPTRWRCNGHARKIRAFHQIRKLARRHVVHVVCGVDSSDDISSLRELAHHCASVEAMPEAKAAVRLRAARALISGHSHTALAHASRRCTARVIDRCRVTGADALVAATAAVAVAENVRHIDGMCKTLDFVDVTSALFEQAARYRARRYVEANHRWDAHGEQLSAVLEATVENRRRVPREVDGGR